MPIYVYIYFDFNELLLFCNSLSTKIHLKSFTYISDYIFTCICYVQLLYYLLVIYIFKYLTL